MNKNWDIVYWFYQVKGLVKALLIDFLEKAGKAGLDSRENMVRIINEIYDENTTFCISWMSIQENKEEFDRDRFHEYSEVGLLLKSNIKDFKETAEDSGFDEKKELLALINEVYSGMAVFVEMSKIDSNKKA